MSEIFDFLKKTEAESRKRIIDLPAAQTLDDIPDVAFSQMAAEPMPEIIASEKFDLNYSTHQLKNALDPLTVIGEQFRALRTRLNLMQKQSGIKTILVASTVPQEGKSFTASGLAGVIAQEAGKRVVVIDADMRKPGSGRDLGISPDAAGTAQVLQGEFEFREKLLSSKEPEFWFLPSGGLPKNPTELLSSPRLEEMLKSATALFDWVIVDSPPVLALTDASLIAPLCDAVVLVVRANSTPAKLVQETINRIGREKICGVVLNRQKQMHSSKYYYQYYKKA